MQKVQLVFGGLCHLVSRGEHRVYESDSTWSFLIRGKDGLP